MLAGLNSFAFKTRKARCAMETTKAVVAAVLASWCLFINAGCGFDYIPPNHPGGSDVFSTNAPDNDTATNNGESKVDSSPPPDEQPGEDTSPNTDGPPEPGPDTTDTITGPDTTDTVDTTADAIDGDSNVDQHDTSVGDDGGTDANDDTDATNEDAEVGSDVGEDVGEDAETAEAETTPLPCICLSDNNPCTDDFCNYADECVHEPIVGCGGGNDVEAPDAGGSDTTGDGADASTDTEPNPEPGPDTTDDSGMGNDNTDATGEVAEVEGDVGEDVGEDAETEEETTPLPCICLTDDNPCTDDLCDDSDECVHEPNSNPCNDSDACTNDDVCVQGKCEGKAADCDDSDLCTKDSCADGKCVHANTCECVDKSECDDGNKCTTDSCKGNKCQYEKVTCNDSDVCTKDFCDATEGCVYVPITGCCHEEVECDDEDVCNGTETCGANKCVTGQKLICNDFNACTSDSCDSVDGCVYEPNSNPCDDSDACTDGDICSQGECTGSLLDCDDQNLCTNDSCDSAIGCVNKQIAGCCLSKADCNDDNLCTDDICTDNLCNNKPIPGCCIKKSDCDDSNVCTADSCANNVCQHALTSPPACCNLDTECDDGDVCNGAEKCASHACASGIAPNCDDDNVCTADSCNPATGCVNKALAACCNLDSECDDGDVCNGAEKCASHACKHLYDAVNDKDFDCVKDQIDNCPDDYNPDQADVDLDGTGDKCDPEKNCTYTKNAGLPTGFWNWPTTGGCVSVCVKKDGSTACLYRHNMDGNCTIDIDGDGAGTDIGDCKEKQFDPDPFWCWGPSGPPPSCLTDGWTATSN
ncbi:MAG: hypothetical protein HY980_00895 [Candidatus Magasanikbacteria bacterium]|nr:hypothetical protein [Candidatus Magasanikbacteria bacterium]